MPPETHLFAGALVNYADDEGYFNANPVLVKAGTNPLREDKTPIETQLEQLERIGYIEVRREGIKCYGWIVKFDEHQRVSHAAPSKIKSKFESLRKSSGEPPEPLRPELNGIELNGTGNRREASTAVAVPATRGKLVCTLPLNQGPDHEVFDEDVQTWIPLYPAVDVRQELRSIKGWLIGNPKLRKTKTGIGRFINAWLARAQNDAKPGAGNGTFKSKSESSFDALKRSLEAGRNQGAADEAVSAETGEDSGAGVCGLLGRPDEVRPDGHTHGPRVISGA